MALIHRAMITYRYDRTTYGTQSDSATVDRR